MEQKHPIDTISWGGGQLLVVYTRGGHRLVGFEESPPGWEGKILRLVDKTGADPDEQTTTNIDVAAIVAIQFKP